MAQDKKTEAIIEAAQKRFAHFGVSKTTMTEIADDLSMSKASLYYYFPDKLNLYAAVIESIIEKGGMTTQEFSGSPDPLMNFLHFLDVRTEFIIKYYTILEYLKTLSADIPKEVRNIFSKGRTSQIDVISTILEKGLVAGKLQVNDPKHVSELLFDCIEGLRFSIIKEKTNFFPEKKQFLALLKKEKEFAEIFFRGLSSTGSSVKKR